MGPPWTCAACFGSFPREWSLPHTVQTPPSFFCRFHHSRLKKIGFPHTPPKIQKAFWVFYFKASSTSNTATYKDHDNR